MTGGRVSGGQATRDGVASRYRTRHVGDWLHRPSSWQRVDLPGYAFMRHMASTLCTRATAFPEPLERKEVHAVGVSAMRVRDPASHEERDNCDLRSERDRR